MLWLLYDHNVHQPRGPRGLWHVTASGEGDLVLAGGQRSRDNPVIVPTSARANCGPQGEHDARKQCGDQRKRGDSCIGSSSPPVAPVSRVQERRRLSWRRGRLA
jgi:hypothetical protein